MSNVRGRDCSVVIKTAYREVGIAYSEETMTITVYRTFGDQGASGWSGWGCGIFRSGYARVMRRGTGRLRRCLPIRWSAINRNRGGRVHGIAKRAGLSVSDIDCCTIPVTLPYVRLRKDIWAELSSLATAYRCHLKCAPEKPLGFAHSPYQTEPLEEDDYSYTFSGENIFYLRKTAQAELYRNTVRLKINLPVVFEKQEIWRYGEAPVLYNDLLQAHYPFKAPFVREIETGEYEGRYRIIEANGKERAVVYADQIDTKEEAESRLEYAGGPLSYSAYDVSTYPDRAILTLHKEADADLYKAAIYGRPIVLDLNRSCFLRDEKGIAAYGTKALNVTGSYFSEYDINGKPHYKEWVNRELAERIQDRREFAVKTHRGLFHARVGAKVQILTQKELLRGTINAFMFRYRKDEAFQSSFKITEGGNH